MQAKETCLYTPPEGLHKVQSAAFQKAHTCEWAFQHWAQEWYLAWAQNALQLHTMGYPLDGATFKYAICEPPTGSNHPLWDAAVEVEKDDMGRKTRQPKYSCRTTSTALQLAADHAFTGSYMARFCPSDPPEVQYCPCGTLGGTPLISHSYAPDSPTTAATWALPLTIAPSPSRCSSHTRRMPIYS